MALFTSSEFKDHEGITSTAHDTFIGQLATRVSIMVARYCNRLAPNGVSALEALGSDLTEYYDGTGEKDLQVVRYPLISVTSVHSDHARAFGAATLVAAADYYMDKRNGRIVLMPNANTAFATQGIFVKGSANVKVVYQGGFATVPEDLKEAAILWASAIFARRRAVGIVSESIGAYSVTYQSTRGEGSVPPEVRGLLSPFRNPAFALGATA
jgi:hypothetical protein